MAPARARQKRKGRRSRTLVAAAIVGVVILVAAGVFLLTRGGGADVAAPAPDSIAMIDSSTNAFDQAIPVGEDPTGIAVGEDGDLWVINQGDVTVNRIDPETGEVTPAKSTLGIPTGVAAGEGAVWITNGFGSQSGTQVVMVDPTTESVEPAFPSGTAKAIVVAFDSIWLADADRDLVLRYDPEDLAADPVEIPTDEGAPESAVPRFLSVGTRAAEGIWVVNELGDNVVRIDPDTNKVAGRIDVESPTAVAADDSGVWVTSEANDRVHHFDAAGRALQTLQHSDGILDGPTEIVIVSSAVWIGSDLETSVARIDPETNTVDGFALGGITGGMAVDGNGDVWVTIRAPQA